MERRNQAVQWPAAVTAEWVVSLCASLEAASHEPAKRLPRFLPAAVLLKLLSAAIEALSVDETLVTLQPPHGTRVVVVGDTHGQLHDVLRMFELAGWPSPEQLFVLNGDYVDRRARVSARMRSADAHATAPTRLGPPHGCLAAWLPPHGCLTRSTAQGRVERGDAGGDDGVEGCAAAVRVCAARQPRVRVRGTCPRFWHTSAACVHADAHALFRRP
jgi:hypothetical protein